MNARSYFLVTALLFAAIAVVHALRLVYGWEVAIGGDAVGLWVSWVGLVVAALLAWQGLRLARR
jgi:hypothetical protein